MKKLFLGLLLVSCCQLGCSKTENQPTVTKTDTSCGTYKSGQQLYKGSEGGCYYINSSGNKTYVERSACSCN
ncbi:hypothetical protein [Mucilaginibacter sp. L3T2-6]|uniref:hypothetical protein n=1 Tax=Mucilaginibacter sp. L3T2-6 TaxID=3062491 RepID=UPI0026770681|nr:hypothetical protein [Mucilaginibacter sp. L3T2-6]MDO3641270.1 hypothetical protein [Mucilaginibacter sp. L3T2-6]MDV6213970.1 hypothetical protein [Mucilaginibacter sp. L3T2-6]